MEEATFLIHDRNFTVLCDHEETLSFTVKSFTQDYTATWEKGGVGNAVSKILADGPNNVLVIDKKVADIYASELSAVPKERVFFIEANEEQKVLNTAVDLINFLQAKKFTKSNQIVVVGGGITQDICGFAAKIYKRGLPWIFFPTTLLAMCDSCIGGKAGLNHNQAKNQLALFSAPNKVMICPEFLQTLTEREIKSGLGEILKLHVMAGQVFLEDFSESVKDGKLGSPEDYKRLVLAALQIKRAVIEEDEFEKHFRKSLNYGHSFGHAIESLTEFAIPHGQAVAFGMIVANEISCARGLLPEAEKQKIAEICKEVIDEQSIAAIRGISAVKLLDILRTDKKVTDNKLDLVVLHQAGHTSFMPVDLNDELVKEVQEIIEREFKLAKGTD